MSAVPILRPRGEGEPGAVLAAQPEWRVDLSGVYASRDVAGRFVELVPDEPIDPVVQVQAGIALRELAEAGAVEIREPVGAQGNEGEVN